jgi:hypothetical protein
MWRIFNKLKAKVLTLRQVGSVVGLASQQYICICEANKVCKIAEKAFGIHSCFSSTITERRASVSKEVVCDSVFYIYLNALYCRQKHRINRVDHQVRY